MSRTRCENNPTLYELVAQECEIEVATIREIDHGKRKGIRGKSLKAKEILIQKRKNLGLPAKLNKEAK